MAGSEEEQEMLAVIAADQAIVRILAESVTLTEATTKILDAIGRRLDWDFGVIWEVQPGDEVLASVDTWLAPGVEAQDFQAVTGAVNFAPGVGLPGRVWASGEPAWIVDVTKDPNFPRAAAAEQSGLRGAFAFPIRGSGHVLGVMEFFSAEIREPDAALLEVMEVTGSRIGQFMEHARSVEELRRSEAFKSAVLDSALECIVTMDHEGRVVEFNAAAESVFGHRREEAVGQVMADLIIPPSLRERHRHALNRYLSTRESRLFGRRLELTGMRSDGSEFPVELTITRIGDYEPPVFAGYIRDATERRKHDDSLQFLADTSAILDTSLDLDATLEKAAGLMVPFLADACTVALFESDGSIKRVAVAADDPQIAQRLSGLRKQSIDPAGPHPIARMLREGGHGNVAEVPDSLLEAIAESPDQLDLLRSGPDPAQGLIVPLSVRGRLVGAISFVSLSSRQGFSAQELSLMEEIARRTAIVIDNARLYGEAQRARKRPAGEPETDAPRGGRGA